MIILRYLCVFTSVFAASLAHGKTPPVKRALIIAIGNYPATSGWSVISSERDIPYMQRLFLRQGFLTDHISVLKDSMATVKGIEDALIKLEAESQQGDIVAVHISAHGEQIEDDNGDEVDGLDESIVAWGALSPGVSTDFQKDQAAYLRDDKFGELIDNLRRKLGSQGDVVVFMDACHSGTGTRGMMKVRGGQPPLTSGRKTVKTAGRDTLGVFRERAAASGDMATYIVFSAARAEELAAETLNENNETMGSLTYALSSVFENLDSSASYRRVFAGVQSVMHQVVRGQHPVLEGTGTERRLFGGRFVSQKPYAEIESIRNSREIQIREGTFTGFREGATVLFCKAGSTEPLPANIIDTGTVIRSSYYSAIVKPRRERIGSPADVWVFLLNPVYDLRTTVAGIATGRSGFSETEAEALKRRLSAVEGIRFGEQPDLVLYKGNQADSLRVASNGYLFQLMPKTAGEKEWQDACRRYSRYMFFSSLDVSDQRFSHAIRFIPIRSGLPDTLLLAKKMVNGYYEFREGDSFMIEIKNSGSKPFYFNVLDLQPDGYINPIMPNRAQKVYARDLQVMPGQTRLFDKGFITLSPPYGEEIFKFFFSAKPLDLELIAAPPPNYTKRANLPFMELLVDKGIQNTRGENLSMTGNTEGAVSQVIFRIVPR